ncbi:hypothetical protein TNCT_653031 [Trichonephila clavata]|uniref:Uncharacterized protein n=1 Tax=Trichonephila clavata TaxID=2740835 RepID=A0A8X6L1E5_TRICU|nr:hypothetical protein TNCT_653031 [Trichonephila clavata]
MLTATVKWSLKRPKPQFSQVVLLRNDHSKTFFGMCSHSLSLLLTGYRRRKRAFSSKPLHWPVLSEATPPAPHTQPSVQHQSHSKPDRGLRIANAIHIPHFSKPKSTNRKEHAVQQSWTAGLGKIIFFKF